MIKRTKIRNNGITFLYEQDPSAGNVTAALFFKAGVLWEKPREFGITHFVLRLLLRAISEKSPGKLTFSPRCGRDHAALLCEAPPDCAEEAVKALAGLLEAPPFHPAAVEQTRADILRELARYTPTKEDREEQLYFDCPPYDVPLTGTAATVASLTAEQLNRWRAACFTPSNACFVLTGGFPDGRSKAIETLLRELPPQKHKNLNFKPLFPGEQFFRTSASDRLLPTDGECAAVSLLFEVDLGEIRPVYAELLRDVLADPAAGVVSAALIRKKLTDTVRGTLRYYTGFAVLALSFPVFHADAAAGVALLAEAVADCRETLTEAVAAPFFARYRENRLYRRGSAADAAYDIGLHNFILYTDDVALPEGASADAVMEQLLEAADRVLIPDNARFLIYYNEKRSAELPAIRQSLAAARIRLFV